MVFLIASIYVQQHKKELIAEASATIQKKYHSTVTIKDIHLSLFEQFPNFSIELKEVDVKGPMFQIHAQKLFTAKNISVRIKTWPLLYGKILLTKTKLEDGQLFIYTDKLGNHNLDELKQKKAAEKNSVVQIPDNIELNKFDIIIKDDQKLKTFHFNIQSLQVQSTKNDSTTILNIKKEMVIKSLIFNHLKGSFLKNQKLIGKYSIVVGKEKMTFKKIELIVGKIPFILTGDFDLKNKGLFILELNTPRIPFDFAKSILTKNISKVLTHIIITKPLGINATINGPLSGGEPKVIAHWQIKKTTIGTTQIQFTDADVEGTFNNQVNKTQEPNDVNSSIILSKLSGNWHEIPIQTSNIQINNLTQPYLKGGFKTQFNLALLNPPLNTDNIVIKRGKGKLDIDYEGPLVNNNEKNTKISASLQINDGEIFIKPIQKNISNTFADLQINNNTIEIKKLTAQTKEGSQLTITGISTHSLAAIPNTPGKANVNINISSPNLNLNEFSSSLQHGLHKKKKSRNLTFSKIDHILENENIHINLNANSIKWQNLVARNLTSSIDLNSGNWRLNNLRMNLGVGNIQLSTKMLTIESRKILTAKFQVNRVKADELLYGMNNFGQNGLSYKNIRGELNIDGELKSPLNKQGGINPNQIDAAINFQIKQGALLNYMPLLKIQEHVFKNRQLDSLQFATIKNAITLNHGTIHIPRMEIATSALNLFVGGDYGLNGNTNMHIQVPLNNLTQKDQSRKMKIASNKEKGGASIFLRAISEPNGQIKIKLDPKGGKYKREQLAQ